MKRSIWHQVKFPICQSRMAKYCFQSKLGTKKHSVNCRYIKYLPYAFSIKIQQDRIYPNTIAGSLWCCEKTEQNGKLGSSSWGLQNPFRNSKILEILICRLCTSYLKCGNDFKDLMIPAKTSLVLLEADASRDYILQINKCFQTRLHPPVNT